MSSYATARELSALTGWGYDLIRRRCIAAGIRNFKKGTFRYYHKEAALALLHSPTTADTYIVPAGYISLPDLAAAAECCKQTAIARCKRAGVPSQLIPRRGQPGTHLFGGHPMRIYPTKQALEACLD